MTKLYHPHTGRPASVADSVADQWRAAGWTDVGPKAGTAETSGEPETSSKPETKAPPRREATREATK